jgi:hypothetical protein
VADARVSKSDNEKRLVRLSAGAEVEAPQAAGGAGLTIMKDLRLVAWEGSTVHVWPPWAGMGVLPARLPRADRCAEQLVGPFPASASTICGTVTPDNCCLLACIRKWRRNGLGTPQSRQRWTFTAA